MNLWKDIVGPGAAPPPPAYDSRTMDLRVDLSNIGMEDERVLAFRAVRGQIVAMLEHALRLPNPDAWVAYWMENDRWSDFDDLMDALRTLAHGEDSPEEARRAEDMNNAERCHDLILDRFGFADDEICFIESTRMRAARIVREFSRVPLEDETLRARDAETAQRFNYASTWNNIVMNSLLVLSDDEEFAQPLVAGSDMVGMMLALARESALEIYYQACEARRIRQQAAPPLPVDTVDPIDEGEDDDLSDLESDEEDLAEIEADIALREAT